MFSVRMTRESINITNKMARMHDHAHDGVRKAFYYVGKALEKTTKEGIKRPPKTGRYYIFKGRRIRASAPGEYPRNRTGDLRKSVGFIVQGSERLIFGSGKIGQRKGQKLLNYAEWLELGTPGLQMKPRPFLIASIRTNHQKTEQLLGQTVREELIR